MKTTTKSEIMAKFEGKKYVQIVFPKVTVSRRVGMTIMDVEEEIADDTVIYMRSEISNIDHFNEIYKDGNKYYLEDSTDACARIVKRAEGKDYVYDCQDLDNADYCLYLAKGDLRKAVKIYRNRYGCGY